MFLFTVFITNNILLLKKQDLIEMWMVYLNFILKYLIDFSISILGNFIKQKGTQTFNFINNVTIISICQNKTFVEIKPLALAYTLLMLYFGS